MRTKLSAALMMAGLLSANFFALSSAQAGQTVTVEEKKLEMILARTQELEKEVKALKVQLHTMRVKKTTASSQIKKKIGEEKIKKSEMPPTAAKEKASISIAPLAAEQEGFYIKSPGFAGDEAIVVPSHYFDGAPVVISPFIGLRSEFDDNDLVVNISDINTDLRLLKQYARLDKMREARGISKDEHPLLELSGLVEAQTYGYRPYVGPYKGDIDLATAELDAAAELNHWAAGFLSIDYDNSFTAPQRARNSRYFLNRGFIVIGNLNAAPYYFTIGQMYVPTGIYDSHLLTTVLPRTLGRTHERAILLGFQQPGENAWNGAIFGYKGSTTPGGRKDGGIHLEQKLHYGDAKMGWGIAYSSNMAEADGMQATGGSGFVGFNETSATEHLEHRVPAIDVHGGFNIGDYDIIGEFVTATTDFSSEDLLFNGEGARPKALNFEVAYRFPLFGYASSAALGYGATWQAFAFNVPRHRMSAVLNTSFWKGTIESIEYRHDINYGTHTTAAGRAGETGALAAVPTTGLGKTSDTLTAQIGVYF